jgi:hypothetical protein
VSSATVVDNRGKTIALVEPMTLAEMELAFSRIGVMIGFLKNRTIERTDRKAVADIA